MMNELSLLLLNATLHDRPVITCMSRCPQSGRRTSVRRRVRFIESHVVLVIFFLLIDLFIHFIIDIKGVLLSS